ncbi:MAG: hypothetical protein AB3N20_13355 [Rhizobiaceae bacterium]
MKSAGETLALMLVFLACLGIATIPAKSAGNPLGTYVGKFSGKGTIRRHPDEPKETVRCRISATLSADGNTLSQNGTCVVPGSKVAVDSELTYNPANGRVVGRWTDVANGSTAGVSGKGDSQIVNLTIVGTDQQTGESRTLWMTLQPTKNGYLLITRSPKPNAGGRFVSGEIRFTK